MTDGENKMDVDEIARRHPSARAGSCVERGCKLKVGSDSEFLILKGEAVDPNHKMCDCLMFGSDGKIVLVELKHSVQHVREIFEKFEKSVAASIGIAAEVGSNASCVILVLVAKNYRNPIEHNRIAAKRIRHKSVTYRINTGSCGDSVRKFAC